MFGADQSCHLRTKCVLASPIRFTNKSDHPEIVTCSVQETAQLSVEVSDYETQVCIRNVFLYNHGHYFSTKNRNFIWILC